MEKDKLKFYKDLKLIYFCKECGVEYRPQRFTYKANLHRCWKCRRLYCSERFKKQTPERQREIKERNYKLGKLWVIKNIEKRRKIALKSYHQRKDEHRARRHRRTRPLK